MFQYVVCVNALFFPHTKCSKETYPVSYKLWATNVKHALDIYCLKYPVTILMLLEHLFDRHEEHIRGISQDDFEDLKIAVKGSRGQDENAIVNGNDYSQIVRDVLYYLAVNGYECSKSGKPYLTVNNCN